MEEKEIRSLILNFFKGDQQKTDLWFKTPNPMLGNLTPNDMIKLERQEKLKAIVDDAMNGNQP